MKSSPESQKGFGKTTTLYQPSRKRNIDKNAKMGRWARAAGSHVPLSFHKLRHSDMSRPDGRLVLSRSAAVDQPDPHASSAWSELFV